MMITLLSLRSKHRQKCLLSFQTRRVVASGTQIPIEKSFPQFLQLYILNVSVHLGTSMPTFAKYHELFFRKTWKNNLLNKPPRSAFFRQSFTQLKYTGLMRCNWKKLTTSYNFWTVFPLLFTLGKICNLTGQQD